MLKILLLLQFPLFLLKTMICIKHETLSIAKNEGKLYVYYVILRTLQQYEPMSQFGDFVA